MIKLTDKEKTLLQYLIDNNQDSMCVEYTEIKPEQINFDINTLKGVLGSLVKKQLLYFSGDNEHYYDNFSFTKPISEEVQIMETGKYIPIKTTDKYLSIIEGRA